MPRYCFELLFSRQQLQTWRLCEDLGSRLCFICNKVADDYDDDDNEVYKVFTIESSETAVTRTHGHPCMSRKHWHVNYIGLKRY